MVQTKTVAMILSIAIATIVVTGIGTTNVIQSAVAQMPPSQIPGCTGDPHGEGDNPDIGDPHQPGATGNPHVVAGHHHSGGC